MYQYVPNIICYSRMVLGGFLWWSIHFHYPVTALWVLSIGAISDFFDGFIARRWDVSSPRGGFLDPLADKVLVLLGFIAVYQHGLIAWWVVLVIAGRDFLLTLARSWMMARGRQLQTLWLAKSKTVVQFCSLYFFIVGSAVYHGIWFDLSVSQRVVVGHVMHMLGIGVAWVTLLSAVLYIPQLLRGRGK